MKPAINLWPICTKSVLFSYWLPVAKVGLSRRSKLHGPSGLYSSLHSAGEKKINLDGAGDGGDLTSLGNTLLYFELPGHCT